MTPKWKVALGHLYEFAVLVAMVYTIFVAAPLLWGQTDKVLSVNGTTVKQPGLPLYGAKVWGATPRQPIITDTLGNLSSTGCPGAGAADICLVDPPFLASSSNAATTTAAIFPIGKIGRVTSCFSFAPNQGVFIAGAGTSGANYLGTVVSCVAGVLSVSPATLTQVASGVTVQHDETAALRAAIAAVGLGSAKIFLPCGPMVLNGPLQDTGGANAVIPMPSLPNYTPTGPTVNIELIGCQRPNWGPTDTGTTIYTSVNSGNLFGGFASGGVYANITNVKLFARNISVRTTQDSPNISIWNASHLLAFQGEHLFVKSNTGALASVSSTGTGVSMPQIDNEVQNYLDDINVSGFFTGYNLTEHTRAGSLYGGANVNCFHFDHGASDPNASYHGNSVSIAYLHCQQGITLLAGPAQGMPPVTVNIAVADAEQMQVDVADGYNGLRGIVNLSHPFPNYCGINKQGGAHLWVTPLYCQTQGPPTVSNVYSGLNIGLSNGYNNTDRDFVLYVNGSVPASTDIATVTFAGSWVDTTGGNSNPMCTVTGQAGAQDHGYRVQGTTASSITIRPGSQAFTAAYESVYVHCSGWGEQ